MAIKTHLSLRAVAECLGFLIWGFLPPDADAKMVLMADENLVWAFVFIHTVVWRLLHLNYSFLVWKPTNSLSKPCRRFVSSHTSWVAFPTPIRYSIMDSCLETYIP
jgi:hypothetical protein